MFVVGMEQLEIARMRQEEFVRDAEHRRLVRSVSKADSRLAVGVRRLVQAVSRRDAAQRAGAEQEAGLGGPVLLGAGNDIY